MANHVRATSAVIGALLMSAGVGQAVAAPQTGSTARGPRTAVIVRGPSSAAATIAVERVGGTVDRTLGLIGGVAAHVSRSGVASLRAEGLAVTPDVALQPTALEFDGEALAVQKAALNPSPDTAASVGNGIGVAVVDSGVDEVPDLAGRVHAAPDFSGEGNTADGYGHGTFMAGLIAGTATGVAPGAHIISVKAGRADGTTNISRVIEGLGWVAMNAPDYNIRVLNLSFGVSMPMAPAGNPLDAAIEAVWSTGLTVVTAAGNEGSTVSSPGDDPFVITVGATDTRGTATTADDVRTSWSGEENLGSYTKPELLAPGELVISTRAPGSTIDREFPGARMGDDYFRGSGTSMATAIASGAAAVLAEHHPAATPDDIKGALVSTGAPVANSYGKAIDLSAADAADADPSWWQHAPFAFGGSDLRSVGVTKNGMPWTAGRWVADYWTAGRWVAGRWVAGRWVDGTYEAGRWVAGRWVDDGFEAGRWVAGRWVGSSWTAGRWVDSFWSAGRWVAGRWVGSSWAAGRWVAGRWVDESWTAGRWVAGRWVAGRWVAGRWVAGRWVAGRWVFSHWADEDWA